MIDETDNQILAILQANSRTTAAEIGRRVRIAASAIFARVRKLEEGGYICCYEARLDPERIGFGVMAFVSVREHPGAKDTATALAHIPEVLEVHHVAGGDGILVKIRARDMKDLRRLVHEQIGTLAQVAATETTIVLDTVKETSRLPVHGAPVATDPIPLTPRGA